MMLEENATCKACRKGKLHKSEVSQAFEREGLEVMIEGIPAFVCDSCGQVYFPPGIGDKLAAAANELFALSEAKHAGGFRAAV